MSNGYFSIQGYQVNTPSSQRTDFGPFNVPFGTVTDVVQYTLAAGTTTIAVPDGTNGVAIVPPIGNPPAGVTLKFKTVLGDSGTFISTAQPSEIQWDEANEQEPANIYLVVAGGSITVTVQFL
jgi:hypothetical protein